MFDNAVDPDRLRPLLPATGGVRVIVTTTDRSFTSFGATVELQGFTRAESRSYLADATNLPDDADADRVADVLGDLPLALSSATATITSRRLDYPHYLRLLSQRRLPDVLARTAGHDYPHSVARAILLSIDAVESATENPDVDAIVAWLLTVMAMLSPSGVTRTLLPDPHGHLDEAIARCVTASLMSWSTTGDSVIMHRLIARILRERAQSASATEPLVHNSLDVIVPALFDDEEAWVRREQGAHLAEQIEAIWDTGLPKTSQPQLLEQVLATRTWAVHQLITSADTARSLTLAEQTHTDYNHLLGPDHPDTLSSRNNLAYAYESAGQLGNAIALYEATLTDRERVLGADHPDTLTSRNNLAGAYRSAGQLGKAIALYEATLTDYERVLGADHPNTFTSRNNLAGAYESAGQLGNAIALYEATLTDYERVLGADHPDTLSSRNNLAGAYRSAGQLGKAIPLFESLLRDCQQILGADHPLTDTVRINLATTQAETIDER